MNSKNSNNGKRSSRNYYSSTKVDNEQEQFPHFRYYKKSKHPTLIVGEQKQSNIDEWKYRKVMHNSYDGRHLNEKVFPNPDPTDKYPMYIAKRVRHDEKKYFSNWKYSWKYPNKKDNK